MVLNDYRIISVSVQWLMGMYLHILNIIYDTRPTACSNVLLLTTELH